MISQKMKFPPKNRQGCYKAETYNMVNNLNKEDHSMIQTQPQSRTLPRGLYSFNLQKRGKIPFFHPYFQGNCAGLKAILDYIYTLGLMNNRFKWKLSVSCHLSQFQKSREFINRFLANLGGSYGI